MPKRSRAFTLVELLVVIGIIAVLVAMLMPVLKKVRAHALKVQCASNLHQLGLALMVYGNQEKGILPIYASANAGNIDGYYAPRTLNNTSPGWVRCLEPIISRNDNLAAWRFAQCPVRGRDYFGHDWTEDPSGARAQGVTTYTCNNLVIGHQSTFWPIPHCRTPIQMSKSHRYMMQYWGSQPWCTEDYSRVLLADNNYLVFSYQYAHSGTANQLYNDGHVADAP